MSTLRRIEALEAHTAPSRGYVVFFPLPGETDAEAWARQYPGQPGPPANAYVVGANWPAETAEDWAEEAKGRAQ